MKDSTTWPRQGGPRLKAHNLVGPPPQHLIVRPICYSLQGVHYLPRLGTHQPPTSMPIQLFLECLPNATWSPTAPARHSCPSRCTWFGRADRALSIRKTSFVVWCQRGWTSSAQSPRPWCQARRQTPRAPTNHTKKEPVREGGLVPLP